MTAHSNDPNPVRYLCLGAGTLVVGLGTALIVAAIASADTDADGDAGSPSTSRATSSASRPARGQSAAGDSTRDNPATPMAAASVSVPAADSSEPADAVLQTAPVVRTRSVVIKTVSAGDTLPAVNTLPFANTLPVANRPARTLTARVPEAPAPAPAPTDAPPAPAATAPPASPTTTTYTAATPLPPRLQWDANFGYCGETSLVNAGLYYGQYMSQYDARALASPGVRQNLEQSQLLLGVNDVAAAKAMHLTATPFNTATQTVTASFLKWVKSNVIAGYPVAIGVFTNEFRFYGDTNPSAGDASYDHIVTVTGITSKQLLTGPTTYYSDDTIKFSDNGLWTGTPTGLPQYAFSSPFSTFARTRRLANASTAPVYSLSNGKNYGIAITGIADRNRETVPVRLATSVNAENPVMVEGGSARPAAKPVTLTVTMSNLKAGTTYTLYRYNNMASVPESAFNANAAKAMQKWKIVATGPTYTMNQTIMSNEIAAYRAVPITAG